MQKALDYKERMYYPNENEVDAWLEEIWLDAQASYKSSLGIELLGNGFTESLCICHIKDMQRIKFSPKGRSPFYAYWQPSPYGRPAPLLVHTPGGGADMCIHPDLVMQGYNILHVNPLGYMTPSGRDQTKIWGDLKYFRVLPDTVTSKAQRGYKQWFSDCLIAMQWAQEQKNVLPDRTSFFGSSQGGFGSLMLGSLCKGRGVRCVAADVPFAADFLLARHLYKSLAYEMAFSPLKDMVKEEDGWYALGFIDLQSHVRRLNLPVMLTAGSEDELCPPATIKSLFDRLTGNKLYYYMDKQGHDYTNQFVTMLTSWFRMYA